MLQRHASQCGDRTESARHGATGQGQNWCMTGQSCGPLATTWFRTHRCCALVSGTIGPAGGQASPLRGGAGRGKACSEGVRDRAERAPSNYGRRGRSRAGGARPQWPEKPDCRFEASLWDVRPKRGAAANRPSNVGFRVAMLGGPSTMAQRHRGWVIVGRLRRHAAPVCGLGILCCDPGRICLLELVTGANPPAPMLDGSINPMPTDQRLLHTAVACPPLPRETGSNVVGGDQPLVARPSKPARMGAWESPAAPSLCCWRKWWPANDSACGGKEEAVPAANIVGIRDAVVAAPDTLESCPLPEGIWAGPLWAGAGNRASGGFCRCEGLCLNHTDPACAGHDPGDYPQIACPTGRNPSLGLKTALGGICSGRLRGCGNREHKRLAGLPLVLAAAAGGPFARADRCEVPPKRACCSTPRLQSSTDAGSRVVCRPGVSQTTLL